MKKIGIIVICLTVINLIILDIFIFKMNKTINETYNEVFKDKVEVKDDEILCVGIFEYNDVEITIYNDGTIQYKGANNPFENNTVVGYGKYEIENNKLLITYNVLENELVEKSKTIIQDKNCNYIEIDENEYTKVSEE